MRGRLPKVGRHKGSKTQKSRSKVAAINADHKSQILRAIHTVFGNPPNAALETKKVVAQHLGKSTKTLNNWIKEGGWTWEDLVAKGARGNKNHK
jgi:hypothetical protein